MTALQKSRAAPQILCSSPALCCRGIFQSSRCRKGRVTASAPAARSPQRWCRSQSFPPRSRCRRAARRSPAQGQAKALRRPSSRLRDLSTRKRAGRCCPGILRGCRSRCARQLFVQGVHPTDDRNGNAGSTKRFGKESVLRVQKRP